MKRALALLLTLFTLFSLAACGGSAELPVSETAAPETPAVTPEPAPEAVPEPTPEPTSEPVPEPTPEIADEGVPLAFTDTQQYEANIFLSNFSEQGFCSAPSARFDSADTSVARLFAFAHLWAKINRRSAIAYEGSYETMTRGDFIDIVDRYFDLDLVPEPTEGKDYSAELGMGNYDWDHCWYSGGRFYYPAADGESYTGFSVVNEARGLSDGHVLLSFTVYELDLQIYWDNNGIPGLYYRLSPGEAAQRAALGEITAMRTGRALCVPFRLEASGRESYRLVSYELDPLD